MLDITLSQIEAVLGQQGKKAGSDYVFQCPLCQDSGKNNLVFSPKKGVLKCFSCFSNEGGQHVLDLINEKFPKTEYVPPKVVETIKEVPKWELNREEYVQYMLLAQEELLKRPELIEYIYQKRGLRKETIENVGLGYDPTENCFVIPIISLKYGCIIDFELRKYSENKEIRRVGGSCSTIAKIWGMEKAKTCYIVEGFIDGFTLLQWLHDKGQEDFTIYSCAHGVGSLYACLNEIKFSNFSEIKMILDNDPPQKNGKDGDGEKFTKKIIEDYPFIKDSRKFLKDSDCKDIGEYYMKKVRK